MPHLIALFVYPVKSCRGIALTRAAVDARGFVGDRRFLVVDAHDRFLTQRVEPRMALIETALNGADLVLAAAGRSAVRVPLQSPARNPELRSVVIWRDTVTAEDCGDEPAAWLTGFLGLPCRLVRQGPAYARPVAERKLPAALAPAGPAGHEVSFADAFPFMLLSEESLADLNRRLPTPLPMNRFRPSLVVAGGAPYGEDEWLRFRIGDVVFHGATRCGRCIVTTTDQSTAERAKEPLATLATYRRDDEGNVMFGRNLIHETKTGRLAVGDAVELL
jgi:MOSC domain-containing protein